MKIINTIASLITAATFATFLGAASAPQPPAYGVLFNESTDWSGVYTGSFVEYTTVNGTPINFWTAGKRVGFNVDTGNIIYGVEGSAGYINDFQSWDLNVVGRLGVELGDATLLYGTTGVGRITSPVSTNYGTVGGGVEVKLTDNLSVRGDYEYKFDIPGASNSAHGFSIGLVYNF